MEVGDGGGSGGEERRGQGPWGGVRESQSGSDVNLARALVRRPRKA